MKILMFLAAVLVAAVFGMAGMAMAEMKGDMKGSADPSMKGEMKTMDGYIIDTKCASGKEARKAEQAGKMDEFVRTHSKDCVLACRAGGCSFYSDGRLWKLDDASSDRIEAFLKEPANALHIKAEVVPAKGDKVSLTNIKNAM